ncbi:hypothetical protein [Gluconobacter sphaericus]|uniref:hypothetical protein n=1 Tax=Gluconobacter sphaericus TaxID=574987 RepID=UPI001B8C0D17|nr:hypothetical protein [Gluconobacter sphaericus]MBS1085046.1 hypothetical protein [Gluconobacter sphaericus]MBS1098736.1 hypothetical protein [Gluconobacter sphaericus]
MSNPFRLYFRRPDVDALAEACVGRMLEKEGSSIRSWSTYEFALNGPDCAFVRIGWSVRKGSTKKAAEGCPCAALSCPVRD